MDPKSFFRGGVQLFFLDEGREDPNTTNSGPSSASQRNTIQTAFRWLAHDGSTLNADWLESFVIFKESGRALLNFLCFFSGGGGGGIGPPAPSPSVSAHVSS